MNLRSFVLIAFSLCLTGASPTESMPGDWPCWRGPDHNAHSRETGIARSWPDAGPPLAWQATGLGDGFSAPSVVGKMVLLMGNISGGEWLYALDRTQQGKLIWKVPIGPVRHDGAGYPGPRSTPTYDQGRIYALGLNGDLLCVEEKDGNLLWRRQLVDELGGKIPTWGYSESVLVDGPWVVCTPGGDRATLASLDRHNGKTNWEAKIGDPAGYSSIVRADIQAVTQYVQFTGRGVIGVRATNGELLWRYDRPANGTANISTPVVRGVEVFAASGYGTGGGLVNIHSEDGTLAANEAYFTKDMKNHHGGLVLHDKFLYGSNDPGLLTCLDWKNGDVIWKSREAGKVSLVFVDGMLICRSEEGPVSLVECSPEGFKLLGRFEQPDRSGQPSWPHPVVAHGQLYLRDQDRLLVYELRGEGGK